jgi:hypothetical protein
MDRHLDPRSIVTPYAFSVHPDLLGRPLATPLQRLGAILADLVVIGFLSLFGGFTLAMGSALLLLWLALRKPGREIFGTIFRWAVGCLGLLVLSVALLVGWFVMNADQAVRMAEEEGITVDVPGMDSPRQGAEEGTGEGAEGEAEEGTGAGFLDAMVALRGLGSLQTAESPEEAQRIANRLARTGRQAGVPMADLRQALLEVMPADAPWSDHASRIVDRAVASVGERGAPAPPGGEEAPVGEERPEAEAGEVPPETGDTASTPAEGRMEDRVEDQMGEAAADSIAALNDRIRAQETELEELEEDYRNTRQALREVEDRGMLAWLWDLIDELGLGFGWGALYLTITHAWWKGTSVGKRLFRIRVVMIDQRPLNWWLSFERAGGYAAGFATGLLGFAQIFWDPNRQAIHDKVSETIVIQDGKEPVPGPWIQEGRAQWTRNRGTPRASRGFEGG